MIDSDPLAKVFTHPPFELRDGNPAFREALTRDELTDVGAAVLHAIENVDLIAAREAHDKISTGENPNRHGPGMFIGNPEIGVEMQAGSSYRSVDNRAISDLAESGVVRGAYTATGGERANTKSHATYWSDAKEGLRHGFNTPTHMIIEAPTDALREGWVSADQITAIHARDNEGEVHDILALARDLAGSSDRI